MEPDDERCLDLMRPTKDMATEIHPHYNEVFQRLDCWSQTMNVAWT